MRYVVVSVFIFLYHTAAAQIILPSYQAVQYKGASGLPTINTIAVSDINPDGASSGGTVVSSGSSDLIAQGVCWSTSTGPTIALSTKTSESTETSPFYSAITALLPSTTYYVRAYATNSSGTAYGSQLSFTTPAITLGCNYGGGKVFYIFAPGDAGYSATVTHGMIIAEILGAVNPWQLSATTTIPTATALGYGYGNTQVIYMTKGAGNYAAAAAYNLVFDGFDDWFLPSKDELNLMFQNRAIVGLPNAGFWWSSTQYSNNMAWGQNFVDGSQSARSTAQFNNGAYVRYF